MSTVSVQDHTKLVRQLSVRITMEFPARDTFRYFLCGPEYDIEGFLRDLDDELNNHGLEIYIADRRVGRGCNDAARPTSRQHKLNLDPSQWGFFVPEIY